MKHFRHKTPAPPLHPEGLERLALRYVSRYATTRAKLRAYLERKVKSRGWASGSEPPIEVVVARMVELGCIDDAAFALARAASLRRRGLGGRRLAPALRAAGVEDADSEPARAAAEAEAWPAALAFAKRKRIGPFAAERPDHEMRSKQLAMLMRAGHRPDIAHRLLDSEPGDIACCD